jgi:hypothetical protein
MTITITSLNAGEEKFNRLLAFLDGNDIVYSTKAALPQTDVVRQSEPLPPSEDDGPFCRSCKRPMDEDEGRWGWCGDCYES